MSDVLVIDAHPRAGSFGAALADAYAAGATAAGASVSRLTLRDLQFDPILHEGYTTPQALEPDLVHAQALITAARHVTLVYPSWWGAAPALLKGFIDRTFLPGWAFTFQSAGKWDRLLAGRSARTIVTMDGPVWAWSLVLGAPGRKAMKGATLEFCGFKPVRVTELGPIRESTAEQRAAWLAGVAAAARTDVAKLPAAQRRLATAG
jgi:putative NADPH-quinone reductase